MKIVYMNDNGTLSVVHPIDDALNGMSYKEYAAIVVPTGKPFRVVPDSYLPVDRTYRDAWVMDEKDLTDGVGA